MSASESVTRLGFFREHSRACNGSNPITCKWRSRDVIPSDSFHFSLKWHQYVAAVEFNLYPVPMKLFSAQSSYRGRQRQGPGHFIFAVRKSPVRNTQIWLEFKKFYARTNERGGWLTWKMVLDLLLQQLWGYTLNPRCLTDLLSSCQTQQELQLRGVNVVTACQISKDKRCCG